MGTKEPYRMFTSRAEYRLILREDNADLRLTEIGRNIGLVSDERWATFCKKREAIEKENQRLNTTWIQPKTPAGDAVNAMVESPLSREYSLKDLLKRPGLSYADIAGLKGDVVSDPRVAEQVEIQAKYDGYITRQKDEIEQMRRYEATPLPENFDYTVIGGLSNEVIQKLDSMKPETLGSASRIQGVTPAAISQILVHMKKLKLARKSA
jgi:tRNA uridine 5-carboxymethylaminomethyl modification enzyme